MRKIRLLLPAIALISTGPVAAQVLDEPACSRSTSGRLENGRIIQLPSDIRKVEWLRFRTIKLSDKKKHLAAPREIAGKMATELCLENIQSKEHLSWTVIAFEIEGQSYFANYNAVGLDDLFKSATELNAAHAVKAALDKYVGKTVWIKAGRYVTDETSGSIRTKAYMAQNLAPHTVDSIAITDNNVIDPRHVVLSIRSETGNSIKQALRVSAIAGESAGWVAEQEFRTYWHTNNPETTYADWSADTWALVRARKVKLGMTRDMVRMAIGDPDKVNGTTSSRGRSEQWVYGTKYVTYYYFDGDVLSTIQD
jgi:hypothetical protein